MKLLVALLLLAFSSASLLAQGGASRAEVEELLKVMRVRELSENSMNQVRAMVTGGAKSTAGAPGRQDKIFALVQAELSWERMKEDYISIYASTFSASEVKGLIAFYQSPVGRAFIDKQPLLMQKTMEMTQKKIAEIGPKMQEAIRSEMSTDPAAKAPAR